ncbi:hypothetical protein [Priestia abyssalis]|nr:hypothetical protein [Priestia abyssalis]
MNDMEVNKMLDVIIVGLLIVLPFLIFGLTEWSTGIVDERNEEK